MNFSLGLFWTIAKNKGLTSFLVSPLFKWCLLAESNHGHGDFQSPALPTELKRHSDLSGINIIDI